MYGIFDVVLDSDLHLPELPELSDIKAASEVFLVREGIENSISTTSLIWLHHWIDDHGEINISCAKIGGNYLLSFPNLVDFFISESGRLIHYVPMPCAAPETIRHLLLDQVVPRVLGHLGRLVIHSSAVVMPDGRCIAFVAKSGFGKSTLASSFHQKGAALITDDCLLLGEDNGNVKGIPNYYGVRLFDDSVMAVFGEKVKRTPVAHYSEKSRMRLLIQAMKHSEHPQIEAIFLLGDPAENNSEDEVLISSVSGANQLMALIQEAFILDVTDKKLLKKQFRLLGKLTSKNLKIYKLQYPRNYNRLPMVFSEVESFL